MYRKEVEAYFADKQDQIIADICRLIRIKSVREDPKPGMPFGEGPCAALQEAIIEYAMAARTAAAWLPAKR